MDTLETAHYAGIGLMIDDTTYRLERCPDPYESHDFEFIFDWSMKLTRAGNSLNRSMGIPDIYPFVVPLPVFRKLDYIHGLLSVKKYI